MPAKFDPIIKKHVRCIKNSENLVLYLSNIIQKELIELLVFQIKKKSLTYQIIPVKKKIQQ